MAYRLYHSQTWGDLGQRDLVLQCQNWRRGTRILRGGTALGLPLASWLCPFGSVARNSSRESSIRTAFYYY